MVVQLDFYWPRKSNKSLWFWPFCCVTPGLEALRCRGKVCNNQPWYLRCKHGQNSPQNTQKATQFHSRNKSQWAVAALTSSESCWWQWKLKKLQFRSITQTDPTDPGRSVKPSQQPSCSAKVRVTQDQWSFCSSLSSTLPCFYISCEETNTTNCQQSETRTSNHVFTHSKDIFSILTLSVMCVLWFVVTGWEHVFVLEQTVFLIVSAQSHLTIATCSW